MLKKIKNILCKLYLLITYSLNKNKFTNKYFKMDGVEIGNYTYGLPNIIRHTNKYKVKIGKFCSIASNVKILIDSDHE